MLIETLLMLSIFFGVGMGIAYSKYFYIVTVIAIMAILALNMYRTKKKDKETKALVSKKWGQMLTGYKKSEYSSELFEKQYSGLEYIVDSITWKDLDMDRVFERINHTESAAGEQALYSILRNPKLEKQKIESFQDTVKGAVEKKQDLINLKFILSKYSSYKNEYIVDFFLNGINVKNKNVWILRFASLVPFLGIVLLFFKPQIGLPILLIAVFLNVFLYNQTTQAIEKELYSLQSIGTILRVAKELSKSKNNIKAPTYNDIKAKYSELKSISKRISKLTFFSNNNLASELEIFSHYFNMVLMRKPIAFYSLVDMLNTQRDSIHEIYNKIGELDAIAAIASYKESLENVALPIFKEETIASLHIEDMVHPLIENPVPNSIRLEGKSALITGSNASGKSTLLTGIGINIIFAQTLGFALAKSYNGSLFKLLTSINTSYDIMGNDSYSMAEAKSILRIIESTGEVPVFGLLDEIYRGTNTAERVSAAKVVLDYLAKRNTIIVAATHDLELTRLVSDSFKNLHFEQNKAEEGMTFDYLLKDGPTQSRNGIDMLKFLGYPDEIYEDSKKYADMYFMEHM